MEPLTSRVPMATIGGNHETCYGENWIQFQARYFTPYVSSGSPDPAYWGREIGPAHAVAINAYAAIYPGSVQYSWLQSYLSSRIRRDRTPWVILLVHIPLYHSNSEHWKEGELIRRSIEPLIMEYGVDIVLSGHVHAYERTYNIFNDSIHPCGPVHLTVGDGGNYDGAASPWRADKPEWSAFRESSFGVGELVIINSTHAKYAWHRHACGSDSKATHHINVSSFCSSPGDNSVNAMDTSDDVFIVRPDAAFCRNRWGTGFEETVDKGHQTDEHLQRRTQELYVLAILLSCGIVAECLVAWKLYRRSIEGLISYVVIDSSDSDQNQL